MRGMHAGVIISKIIRFPVGLEAKMHVNGFISIEREPTYVHLNSTRIVLKESLYYCPVIRNHVVT